MRSNQPPKYALATPRISPMVAPTRAEMKPTSSAAADQEGELDADDGDDRQKRVFQRMPVDARRGPLRAPSSKAAMARASTCATAATAAAMSVPAPAREGSRG
jgi:hypothetical protein